LDRKTALVLSLGKYGGYLAVLWVSIVNSGLTPFGPLLPFFFVFALDNIRTYYLEDKLPNLIVPSLYVQMLLAFIFIFLDGTAIGAILLIILIAESLLAYPRPHGERILLLSLAGLLSANAASLYIKSDLNWVNMASTLINSLFFFFVYGVSYMARRQREEKERAEDALEKLNRSRTELEIAHNKLIEANKEKEQLVAAEERARLARELHDTLAHTLTAIIVSLEAGKKLLEKDPGKVLMEISKSQEQARKGLEEVRLTVKTLRSDNLEKMDFFTALKGLGRDYSGSGIDIHFDLDKDLIIPPSLQTTVYRIVQESITNSVRHGEANQIKVRLSGNKQSLHLEVEDDGRGCDSILEGHGLQGIRERAAAAGGRVSFSSSDNGGFLVNLIVEDYLHERSD